MKKRKLTITNIWLGGSEDIAIHNSYKGVYVALHSSLRDSVGFRLTRTINSKAPAILIQHEELELPF